MHARFARFLLALGLALALATPAVAQTIKIATLAPDGSANTAIIRPGSAIKETFLGNSASPRITAGIGVNWNSPFGPFRIDFAQTIRKVEGDDERRFTFNVGTQF